MHQVTGYDPRDRSRLELAFEIHREFLPKADRSASLDTWIKKVAPAMKEDETDRVFRGRWFDRLDDVR